MKRKRPRKEVKALDIEKYEMVKDCSTCAYIVNHMFEYCGKMKDGVACPDHSFLPW